MNSVFFLSLSVFFNVWTIISCDSDCLTVKKEMRAKASACWKKPSQRDSVFYIPVCDEDTGDYLPEQCIHLLDSLECWCVDPQGHEIESTRRAGTAGVNGCSPGRLAIGVASEKNLEDRQVSNLVHRVNQCIRSG